MNDETLIKYNQDALDLKEKAELEIKNIREIIFKGSLIEFELNKEKMKRSILCEIFQTPVINMNSSILTPENQI